MKKNRLYWILQFGGWGGLTMTSFLGMFFFIPTIPVIGANVVTMLMGVFVSHIYRLYVKKRNWKDLRIAKLIPKVLAGSIIQSIVLMVVIIMTMAVTFAIIAKTNPDGITSWFLMPEVEGMDEETMKQLEAANKQMFTPAVMIGLAASLIASFSIYFVSWSALYFAYQYLQKSRAAEIEKWKLQASVKDAELGALKSQINPHFMFNSLNNIRSLVVEDSESARDMITHLSDLLRFSIQFDQYEKISLEKEIEVVKDYLLLESIQLEERLHYEINIPVEAQELTVPPMILQTLTENAIKHSINDLPNGGEIIIESKVDDEFLTLYVKNTGQIVESTETKRKGIGIANARERLRLLYGELSQLTVENMNEYMVCATVKIPLK